MSTQRREDRSNPATGIGSLVCGIRERIRCMSPAVAVRDFNPGLNARHDHARSFAETARPMDLATSATTSLPMDHPHRKFVSPAHAARWTSPRSSGSIAKLIRQATRRTFLPLIPIPPDSALLRQTLPQDPAAESRRAERYDGKGNLYFKHAA